MRRVAPAARTVTGHGPLRPVLPMPLPSYFLLALVLLVKLVSTSPDTVDYTGWRVLRVEPASAVQQRQVELRVQALGPAAAEIWRRRSTLDVLLHPDAFDDLQGFLHDEGIAARVHVRDVGQEIRRERSLVTLRTLSNRPDLLNSYLRYEEINEYLENLQHHYSQLVNVRTFGNSYEGRPLKVIKISTGGGEQRPVILVDAGIHAREWIAPAMALYLIQQLVENSTNHYLIASVDWHIIPLLNPDGYEYSHTTDRMWRKTRSRTDISSCFGVDPNRNFDFYWGVVGVSWDPCRETYAGPAPHSENEVQALAEYGMFLRGRLRLYISVHSYGGLFIYPWGYTHKMARDAEKMAALGHDAANAIKAAGIPQFDVGNCFETLGELASGGSDDWMKAKAGTNYSYTLEMPVPSFTTPAAHIQNYVKPTFEGFRVMGRSIAAIYG